MLKKTLSPLLLLLVTQSLIADELIIGIGQQGQNALQAAKPERGISMEQVGETYGQPVSIDGPTGNPSIETWHYEYFSVYFEGNTVIHSVIKHIRQDQQGDASQ